MALGRKKKQNDFEKIFDLDPDEKVKEEKVVTPEKAEKKRKIKSVFRKILVIGIPVMAVVAAAVLLIVHHSNNTGYRLEINTAISAVMDDDATALCENLSGLDYRGLTYDEFLVKRYMNISYTLDEFVDSISEESGVESFRDEDGKPAAYKAKIVNTDKLSKSEVEGLVSDSVEEGTEPSVKASDIDEIRRVDIDLTVTGSKFVTEYMIYNIYAVKESGQWKIFIDMNSMDTEQISQSFPED